MFDVLFVAIITPDHVHAQTSHRAVQSSILVCIDVLFVAIITLDHVHAQTSHRAVQSSILVCIDVLFVAIISHWTMCMHKHRIEQFKVQFWYVLMCCLLLSSHWTMCMHKHRIEQFKVQFWYVLMCCLLLSSHWTMCMHKHRIEQFQVTFLHLFTEKCFLQLFMCVYYTSNVYLSSTARCGGDGADRFYQL